MPNANRPNGFEPYGPIKQTASLQCGSTVATNEFVSLASDGAIDPAIAGGTILGLALQPGVVGDYVLVSVDPEQLYVGQADGSDIDADSDRGKCCDIVATASSSVYKSARQEIDSSTISATEGQLFIVKINPRTNNFSGSKAEVIVKVNEHQAFGDPIEVDASFTMETAQLVLNTGNDLGGGAGNLIRRFTTVEVNTGAGDFYTYTDSATNGASITILRACKIVAHWIDSLDGTTYQIGFSINAPDLTVAIGSLSATNRLSYTPGPSNWYYNTTIAKICAINDVIRPHVGQVGSWHSTALVRLSMTFIGLD